MSCPSSPRFNSWLIVLTMISSITIRKSSGASTYMDGVGQCFVIHDSAYESLVLRFGWKFYLELPGISGRSTDFRGSDDRMHFRSRWICYQTEVLTLTLGIRWPAPGWQMWSTHDLAARNPACCRREVASIFSWFRFTITLHRTLITLHSNMMPRQLSGRRTQSDLPSWENRLEKLRYPRYYRIYATTRIAWGQPWASLLTCEAKLDFMLRLFQSPAVMVPHSGCEWCVAP